MTGVRWLAREVEYWPEEEGWVEPIPMEDGYEDLEASMVILFAVQMNWLDAYRHNVWDLVWGGRILGL